MIRSLHNPRLDGVPESSFRMLDRLFADVAPPAGVEPIGLHVGDPTHGVPDFVMTDIAAHAELFGKYSPISGTPRLREAIAGYLARRYGLAPEMIAAEVEVLPVAGLREAMFLVALAVIPPSKKGKRPAVALPNPYYHSYAGAAITLGADPVYMSAVRESGFLPDFASLDEETLVRLAAVYLCSPANPQGSVADLDYLSGIVALARAHDFVLLVDECYAEIHTDEPPAGVLEACARLGGAARNVLAFHSLSKRSNAPGLRSGFVAGDPDLLRRFRALRDVGGVAIPGPVQAASAALWDDDEHVRASRGLYRAKFEAAARMLGNRFGHYTPAGGMFLWLDVGDGVAATRRLWTEAAVQVMPGRFMSAEAPDGSYPGDPYVRVALVPDLETTTAALERISRVL